MITRGWNPVDIIGFVRNQFGHLLCWGFASTDLLSAGCVLHGWEDEYCEFCPLHLCLCCNPTLIGKDVNARVGHVCYAYSFLYGLQYIRVLGVPRVGIDRAGSDFSCTEIPPLAPFGEASNISERVSEVRSIETLEEALHELKSHPVGCYVLCYPELFTPYEHFIGPRRGRSGKLVDPEIESTVNKQMKNELDVFSEEAVIPEASREVYRDPIRMGGECAFDSLENESKAEEKELNKESG